MSTKTTFKRIALVAVAALGLGVLSVAPSQATVSGLTVTGANGTSTLSASAYKSDSTTAAVVTLSGALLDTAGDSITVTLVEKSIPSTTTSSASKAYLYYLDSTTPAASSTVIETATAGGTGARASGYAGEFAKYLSASDTNTGLIAGGTAWAYRVRHASTGYVGAKFAVQLDSTTTRVAGTYTYTVIVKTYNSGATTNAPATTTLQDVSIVVSASAATLALAGGTIDPSKTTAYLNAGATWTTDNDSSVVAVSTATGTNVGALRVRTYTVDSDPAPESVTVTVSGPGLICTTVCGKSLKVIGTGGDTTFTVQADGTAGTASIVVATTTKTFAAKTVSFYAKSAATLVPTVRIPVLKVGDNVGAVSVAGTDSTGALWPGQAYIVASSAADAAIAGSTTPVACAAYNSTDGIRCPITATTAGTAKFKIIDASTVATATATSAEFSVTASASQPGSFKIAFDKATYGPGEKATIIVTPLDIDGKALPANDIVNALTSTGITSTVGFTSGSDSSSLAVTTISPSAASSAETLTSPDANGM